MHGLIGFRGLGLKVRCFVCRVSDPGEGSRSCAVG